MWGALKPWPNPIERTECTGSPQIVVISGRKGRECCWQVLMPTAKNHDHQTPNPNDGKHTSRSPKSHTLKPEPQTLKCKPGGVYSVVRHPLYGGLLLTCFGLSVIGMSFPRLFVSTIHSTFRHMRICIHTPNRCYRPVWNGQVGGLGLFFPKILSPIGGKATLNSLRHCFEATCPPRH